MKLNVLSIAVAAGSACAALAAGLPASSPAVAATPPPTPPPMSAPASASPSPATPEPLPSGFTIPQGYKPASAGSPAPAPSPSAPADNRKGIEGVWEVAIQRSDKTEYTHFTIKQDGSTLSGTYRDNAGKKYPIAGSVDGQSIRLLVSMPDGTSLLLEGRLDGTSDMVGMLTSAKEQVPFTAGYRPKEKWIENVNPSPGGIGMPSGGGGVGGGGGAGGGGYPPR